MTAKPSHHGAPLNHVANFHSQGTNDKLLTCFHLQRTNYRLLTCLRFDTTLNHIIRTGLWDWSGRQQTRHARFPRWKSINFTPTACVWRGKGDTRSELHLSSHYDISHANIVTQRSGSMCWKCGVWREITCYKPEYCVWKETKASDQPLALKYIFRGSGICLTTY